ncbi:MAG: hypothetical protein VW802_08695 [Rhodospirillaceae bacterium]|jgi:hypothetical protein
MSVLPLNVKPRDWNDEEQKIFKALHEFRIARARNCEYITGLADNNAPYFTLYVGNTGEVIFHVCRGPNEQGYIVMGPTRKTCFVKNIKELYRCFGILKAGHTPERYAHGNNC